MNCRPVLTVWCISVFSGACGHPAENLRTRSAPRSETARLAEMPADVQADVPGISAAANGRDDAPASEFFIARAYRALMGSEVPTPESIASFRGLSRKEVVDRMLELPAFHVTAADFALSFLGEPGELFRAEHKVTDASGKTLTLLFPLDKILPGLRAAQSLGEHDDFFSFLDRRQDGIIVARRPRPPHGRLPSELSARIDQNAYDAGSEAVRIGLIVDALQRQVDEAVALLQSGLWEESCQKVTQLPVYGLVDNSALIDRFFPRATQAFQDAQFACFEDDRETFVSVFPSASEAMKQALAESLALLSQIPLFDSSKPLWSQNLFELSRLGQGAGLPPGASVTVDVMSDFFQSHPNSSTNFNRNRSAAFFKTYFCDDLEPLEAVLPGGHQGDDSAHASDPACQACHYRLDPLSGFFKDRGAIGIDFVHDPTYGGFERQIREAVGLPDDVKRFFVFDDLTTLIGDEVDAYQNAWRDPVSGRYRIGFIRSTVDESLNSMGENLDDLFQIIRGSPEVKACVTRRMVEYFIGPEQSYSGQWLAGLRKTLTEGDKDKVTGGSFRRTVREIVLSRAFSEQDPEPGVCYDGEAHPYGAPACTIQHLFETNCQRCHSRSAASGGLAVDEWIAWTNGSGGDVWNVEAEGVFRHTVDGRQLSPAESFGRILGALRSADPLQRMPLMQHMDALERQEMIRWVEEQL